MTPRASTVRPVSCLGAIVSLGALAIAAALASLLLGPGRGLIVGAVVFLAYRIIIVRRVLTREHTRGIALTRRGEFAAAIEHFRASERYFERVDWLDRWRWLLLGSATPYRFRDLARHNRAYCLARLGRGADALELLDTLLAESPSMLIAHELRELLRAGAASRGVGPASGSPPA